MVSRNPTEHDLQQFSGVIGMLTIRWGDIEGTLNMMIALVYQVAGGRHVEAELPYMFINRVKFLRRCFRAISALQPYAVEGVAILDRMMALSKTREIVGHGFLSEVSDDPLTAHFVSIRPDKARTMHTAKTTPMTHAALIEAANSGGRLALDNARLCERLVEAFVEEKPSA